MVMEILENVGCRQKNASSAELYLNNFVRR